MQQTHGLNDLAVPLYNFWMADPVYYGKWRATNKLPKSKAPDVLSALKNYSPFAAGEPLPTVCDHRGRVWGAREASHVLTMFRKGFGYAEIVEACGVPYFIDNHLMVGAPQLEAWAHAYTLDPANRHALGLQIVGAIADGALNRVTAADIATWNEKGEITSIKTPDKMTAAEKAAIQKIGVDAKGKIVLVMKDFTAQQAMLARIAGVMQPPDEPEAPQDHREDILRALEKTNQNLNEMIRTPPALPSGAGVGGGAVIDVEAER